MKEKQAFRDLLDLMSELECAVHVAAARFRIKMRLMHTRSACRLQTCAVPVQDVYAGYTYSLNKRACHEA